jgi:hypothetical protein
MNWRERLEGKGPGGWVIWQGEGASGLYFACNCPCGCEDEVIIPIGYQHEPNYGWGWDGNKERPTLTPSLRRIGSCASHFNLTAGNYVWHGDSPRPIAPNVWRAA